MIFIKEKIRCLSEKIKSKFVVGCTVGALSALSIAGCAFAAEGDTTTTTSKVAQTMATSFTQLSDEFYEVVALVGPIAVGIVAVFMVWRLGVKFFKGITN